MGDQTTKLLCFDPAISITGWVLLEYNTATGQLKVVKHGLIKPTAEASRVKHKAAVSKVGKRVISLNVLRDKLRALIKSHKPDFVAAEDAFFNPRFPGAYEPLVQWLITAKHLLYDEFDSTLHVIPTKVAKKMVTGTGSSLKQPVQAALERRGDISTADGISIPDLSPHECDAIAVGVGFVYTDLVNILANEA